MKQNWQKLQESSGNVQLLSLPNIHTRTRKEKSRFIQRLSVYGILFLIMITSHALKITLLHHSSEERKAWRGRNLNDFLGERRHQTKALIFTVGVHEISYLVTPLYLQYQKRMYPVTKQMKIKWPFSPLLVITTTSTKYWNFTTCLQQWFRQYWNSNHVM